MPRTQTNETTGTSNIVAIFASVIQAVIFACPLLALYETTSDHVTEYTLMVVWIHMLLRGTNTDEFAIGSNILMSWTVTLMAALVTVQVIDQQLGSVWSLTNWDWNDFALNWDSVLKLREAHNSVFMWSVVVAVDLLYPLLVNSASFISQALRGIGKIKTGPHKQFYFVPHAILVILSLVSEIVIIAIALSSYGWSRTVWCELIKGVLLVFATSCLGLFETLPHEDVFDHGGGVFILLFCQLHLPTVAWYFIDKKVGLEDLTTPLSDVSVARAFQLVILFVANVFCVRNTHEELKETEKAEEIEYLIEIAKAKAKENDVYYDSGDEYEFRDDMATMSETDDDTLDEAQDASFKAFLLSPVWAVWSILRCMYAYCTDVICAPTVVSIVYIILTMSIVDNYYGSLLVTSSMSFPGPLLKLLTEVTDTGIDVIKNVFEISANEWFITFLAMSPVENMIRYIRGHLKAFVLGPFKTINATVNGFPVNATLDFTDHPDLVFSFIPLVLCAMTMVFQSLTPIQRLMRTHMFWSICSLAAMLPIPMIMYGMDIEPRIWAAIVKNSTFTQTYTDDCKDLLILLIVLTGLSLLVMMFVRPIRQATEEDMTVQVIDSKKKKKKIKGKIV